MAVAKVTSQSPHFQISRQRKVSILVSNSRELTHNSLLSHNAIQALAFNELARAHFAKMRPKSVQKNCAEKKHAHSLAHHARTYYTKVCASCCHPSPGALRMCKCAKRRVTGDSNLHKLRCNTRTRVRRVWYRKVRRKGEAKFCNFGAADQKCWAGRKF